MIGLPELMFILPIVALAATGWWLWAVSRGGRTARMALMIGAGVALALVIIGGVLLARNWSAIASFYRSAAAALPDLERVQKADQEKYGGTVNVNAKHQVGVDGAILSVTLTNPPFLDQIDPDGADGKERARDVAAASREALMDQSAYQKFEVILVRARGVGVTFTRSWAFSFELNELRR